MHLVWIILNQKWQYVKLISKLLAYHQLGSGIHIGLNRISSAKFETHLKILNEMGFSSNPEYEILFDDGYESVFNIAFTLMQKYGFIGHVFPVVGYIGKMNDWDVTFASINKAKHLDASQIKILSDNGWEIGSHGLTHTAFTSLSYEKLKIELDLSKQILEDIIQKKVTSITPPFSRWNNHIKDLILDRGYKKIYYQHGFNFQTDNTMIPRHSVYSIDGENSIIRKLNNSKLEAVKELIIHKCSTLTVAVKEIL
tara:strand:+ start:3968 stop:4729 length:762 start_codon:yes stop_codon:yes gene_type:complete